MQRRLKPSRECGHLLGVTGFSTLFGKGRAKIMSKSIFRLAVASAFMSLLAVGTALAQDFQRTYSIGAGGSVNIHNVSGDVKIIGYDGGTIIVTCVKEGRDRDKVEVEDSSGGHSV